MRLRYSWLVLASLVTPIAGAEPAAWTPHELIVDLHDLPKHYSCDELWYKFRDLLLTLGARQDMEILPYQCEANSPRVQLRFSTPRRLQDASAKWSELSAVTRTVRIAPGSPKKLDSDDCVLVSQVKSSLLPYLGDPIISYRLACRAPRETGQPAFVLTAKVVVPQ